MARPALREKYLHWAFEWALVLKALDSVAEVAAGIGAFFVSNAALLRIARTLTHGELQEDPRDLVANLILRSAEHLSASTQHFMGLYVLSHGVVKLGLVAALLGKKLWAYPLAIAVFALFIAYQIYRYAHTGSISLIFLTVLDLVVIALTWHEYRYLRSGQRATPGARIR